VRVLGKLEQERKEEDAWKLQGKVYIDEYMSEDIKVEEPWRRIKIV
jgi:hypothetical protein